MPGFLEWTALTSEGVSMAKNLKRLGVMDTYMYSTRAIVTRAPATYRRFSKAGKIMVRSYLLCHIM